MRPLLFLAGCLLGGLSTCAVQSFAASEVGPDLLRPATDGPESASGELAALRAEVAHLRQRPAGGDAVRGDAAAAGTAPAAGQEPTAADAATAAQVELLLRELGEQLHAGVLRPRFQPPHGALAELGDLVLGAWIDAGMPERALQLLRHGPLPGLSREVFTQLSQALLTRGDRAGASETLVQALRHNPLHWGAVQALAELDPAAGLQMLDTYVPGPGEDAFDPQSFDWHRAAFLIAAHRGAEAREIVERLRKGQGDEGTSMDALTSFDEISHDEAPPDLDQLLARYEPKLALELFDRRLAADGDDFTLALRRAEALRNQGRPKDAVAAARNLLQKHPDHDAAWELLVQIDRNEALRLVTASAQQEPTTAAWLRQADLLRTMQRGEEAAAALEQAWQLDPRVAAWPMLRMDEARFLPRVTELARKAHDDELLGECGDHAWRRGARDEALGFWREAQGIDPQDGEWRRKVRTAQRGGNPLE